jgi:hypothetical protein
MKKLTENMGLVVQDDRYYIKQVIQILGARRANTLPESIGRQITTRLSKWYFYFRLPEGLVLWFECWCNHEGVINSKREEAKIYAQKGFRAAFLDTQFSTRKVGDRRPLILIPPNSKVDIAVIVQKLLEANYQGPTNYCKNSP